MNKRGREKVLAGSISFALTIITVIAIIASFTFSVQNVSGYSFVKEDCEDSAKYPPSS